MNKFKVGASYLCLGALTSEPASGVPKYGEKIETGALAEFAEKPASSSASAYGDNKKIATSTVRTGTEVTAKFYGMSQEGYAAMYGHTISSKTLERSFDDQAPYMGVGFIQKILTGDGKVEWKAMLYTKVQAAPGEWTQATAGDTITYNADNISLQAVQPVGCGFSREEIHETEAAAKEWLDAFFGA